MPNFFTVGHEREENVGGTPLGGTPNNAWIPQGSFKDFFQYIGDGVYINTNLRFPRQSSIGRFFGFTESVTAQDEEESDPESDDGEGDEAAEEEICDNGMITATPDSSCTRSLTTETFVPKSKNWDDAYILMVPLQGGYCFGNSEPEWTCCHDYESAFERPSDCDPSDECVTQKVGNEWPDAEGVPRQCFPNRFLVSMENITIKWIGLNARGRGSNHQRAACASMHSFETSLVRAHGGWLCVHVACLGSLRAPIFTSRQTLTVSA